MYIFFAKMPRCVKRRLQIVHCLWYLTVPDAGNGHWQWQPGGHGGHDEEWAEEAHEEEWVEGWLWKSPADPVHFPKAASSGDDDDDWGEDFWEEETKEDEWDHWQDADEMQTNGSHFVIAEIVKAASQYPVQRLHVSPLPQDRGGQRSQGKGNVGRQVDPLSYLSRSLETCRW